MLQDQERIIQLRKSLSDRNDEFRILTGVDLNESVSKVEGENGLQDISSACKIRSRSDILNDLMRCQDFYALSSKTSSLISEMRDSEYYGDVDISDDAATHLDMIRASSLKDEWDVSYPDEDFAEAASEESKEYYTEKTAFLQRYIAYKKNTNAEQRKASQAMADGDVIDYKWCLDRIHDGNGNIRSARIRWANTYGVDNLDDVTSDLYDELCPNDDFEWYTPETSDIENGAEYEELYY